MEAETRPERPPDQLPPLRRHPTMPSESVTVQSEDEEKDDMAKEAQELGVEEGQRLSLSSVPRDNEELYDDDSSSSSSSASMVAPEELRTTDEEIMLSDTQCFFDPNGDGTVDVGEFQRMLELLQAADEDHDGRISSDEFRKVQASIQHHREKKARLKKSDNLTRVMMGAKTHPVDEEEAADDPSDYLPNVVVMLRKNPILFSSFLGWNLFFTIFYSYYIFEGNWAQGFYYCVQAGLSIGFGVLSEDKPASLWMTIINVVLGALLIAFVLAEFSKSLTCFS